jgi:hypothetical protein
VRIDVYDKKNVSPVATHGHAPSLLKKIKDPMAIMIRVAELIAGCF